MTVNHKKGEGVMKFKIMGLVVLGVVLVLKSYSFAWDYQVTFTPEISVSTEYTDNVFLSENREYHDIITLFSPTFNLELLGMNRGVNISYTPAYSLYEEWSENNAWRHSLDFFGWTDITAHTRLEIDNTFLRTEDPLGEEDVYLPSGEPLVELDGTTERNRETYYTNTTRINLTHQFGEDDSFFVQYVHGLRGSDDPEDEDHTSYNPSIGMTYWFGPRWGVETDAGYISTHYSGGTGDSDDFEEWDGNIRLIRRFTHHLEGFVRYGYSTTDYDGEEEDYDVQDSTVGFDYEPSENRHVSFEIGYWTQDYDESGSNSGMKVDGEFEQTFRRGLISFSGAAGEQAAHYGAENLGLSKYYQVESHGEYQLTRRIAADFSGLYRKDDYQDEDPEREDKTKRFNVGLSWLCRNWLSFRVDYAYNVVDSTDDEEGYRENSVLFTVSLVPPRPYRLTD